MRAAALLLMFLGCGSTATEPLPQTCSESFGPVPPDKSRYRTFIGCACFLETDQIWCVD